MTSTERVTLSRQRRQTRTVTLPKTALDDAETIRQRDRDASLTAAIVRVLSEASGRK